MSNTDNNATIKEMPDELRMFVNNFNYLRIRYGMGSLHYSTENSNSNNINTVKIEDNYEDSEYNKYILSCLEEDDMNEKYDNNFWKDNYLSKLKIDRLLIIEPVVWKDVIRYAMETRKIRASENFIEVKRLWENNHKNKMTVHFFNNIDTFEKDNNITLPLELKIYLLEISMYTFKPHLQYQYIDLSTEPDNFPLLQAFYPRRMVSNSYLDPDFNIKYIREKKNEPDMSKEKVQHILNQEYYYTPSELTKLVEQGVLDKDYKFETEEDDSLFGEGTLHIREIGCGYFDFMVLNGKFRGSVWSNHLAGDGPILKEYNSFFEYILEKNRTQEAKTLDYANRLHKAMLYDDMVLA